MSSIYELTSSVMLDQEVKKQVKQGFSFGRVSAVCMEEAIQLEHFHGRQLERGMIKHVHIPTLQRAELFMRASSAFALMDTYQPEFTALFAKVNKRG